MRQVDVRLLVASQTHAAPARLQDATTFKNVGTITHSNISTAYADLYILRHAGPLTAAPCGHLHKRWCALAPVDARWSALPPAVGTMLQLAPMHPPSRPLWLRVAGS